MLLFTATFGYYKIRNQKTSWIATIDKAHQIIINYHQIKSSSRTDIFIPEISVEFKKCILQTLFYAMFFLCSDVFWKIFVD